MNQCIVAGLGNIYVNETCIFVKLILKNLGCKIKDKDIRKLISVIKKILKNAIIAGGSTINNYHNSEGKTGSYQKNFKVYDREGKECLRTSCNGKIKTDNTLRAVYFLLFKMSNIVLTRIKKII